MSDVGHIAASGACNHEWSMSAKKGPVATGRLYGRQIDHMRFGSVSKGYFANGYGEAKSGSLLAGPFATVVRYSAANLQNDPPVRTS